MGAAGAVTVYYLDAIEAAYRRMWPDHDLYADLPYLNDPIGHDHARHRCWPDGGDCRKRDEHYRTLIAHLPNGQRLLVDYSDDQGNNDGLDNDFWFNADWDDLVDRPDWMACSGAVPEKWTQPDDGSRGSYERWPDKTWGSYARFHAALNDPDVWRQTVEVWT